MYQLSNIKYLLLLCTLLSPGLLKSSIMQQAGLARSSGPTMAYAQKIPVETTRLPLDAAGIKKAIEQFSSVIENPYNMSNLFGVPTEDLEALGIPEEYIKSAQRVKDNFRQGLTTAFNGASEALQNGTSAFRIGNMSLGNGTLLKSMINASVPIVVAEDGQTPMLPVMTVVGTWLGQQVQLLVKQFGGEGQELEGLTATTNGRKLMQMDQTPFDAVEDLDIVAAAARDVERIKSYISNLAGAFNEMIEAEEAQKKGAAAEETEDDNDLDGSASSSRKLQQDDGTLPNNVFAKAARFIFTNVFDLFRANGLYGLTPIIADVRGILTRYNWASDLLQIIAAPVENFVNANYFPLPQTNDDFIKLVRKFFSDYCTFEKATNSEQILGEYEGPSFTVELVPVSCPIYQDPVTGRSYVSFADCDPAELVITVDPLTITSAYSSAATYTSAECKYQEVFGTDFELAIGGGEQTFTFTRSANGLDIVPTIIQQNANLHFSGQEAPLPIGNNAANGLNRPNNGNTGLGVQLDVTANRTDGQSDSSIKLSPNKLAGSSKP